MDSENRTKTKQIIEALLFVSDKPLSVDQISGVLGEGQGRLIREILNELGEEYSREDKGILLSEIAGGFQFFTRPELAPAIKKFHEVRDRKHLSHASLETLSVIAYRQPVTRQEIEWIRGVNVDGALRTLLEKGLVRVAGRKEVPGRPILYSTTQEFLDHFGLSSLQSLPRLAEFTEKDIADHLLPPELKEPAGEEVSDPGEEFDPEKENFLKENPIREGM